MPYGIGIQPNAQSGFINWILHLSQMNHDNFVPLSVAMLLTVTITTGLCCNLDLVLSVNSCQDTFFLLEGRFIISRIFYKDNVIEALFS